MKTKQLTRLWLTVLILLMVGLGSAAKVQAHEIRPALLNIIEKEPGWFEVTWKVPVLSGYNLDIQPVLPATWRPMDHLPTMISPAPWSSIPPTRRKAAPWPVRP